jgi:hypothetical protein
VVILGVVKTGPGSGGKSWLGLDKRLSRADEQCRKPRDARVRLVSKMAERMSLSVGVEGGWVEMMPRDARRARKRYDARFRIWRRQISGWLGWEREREMDASLLAHSTWHLVAP